MANDAEPHVLDQPWRRWATIAVIGILLAGVVLGVVIIPVVQGRSAGLDAYTAICRALGILPGSPAQPQPADRTPPSPVSQVSWTPEVLQILARADTKRGHAKVVGGGWGGATRSVAMPRSSRCVWRATASRESRPRRKIPISMASPAPPSTSSCMII